MPRPSISMLEALAGAAPFDFHLEAEAGAGPFDFHA
jgi:hypothetical protein